MSHCYRLKVTKVVEILHSQLSLMPNNRTVTRRRSVLYYGSRSNSDNILNFFQFTDLYYDYKTINALLLNFAFILSI